MSRALELASPHGEGGAQAVAGQFLPEADRAAEPRVIGVDLSLRATGLADRYDTWTIETSGRKNDDYATRGRRINHIVCRILDEHVIGKNVDLAVIEGPSYRSADPGAFDRAGLWWRVYNMLTTHDVPVAVVTPATRMRYATGKGQIGKGAVLEAVIRRWPHWTVNGDDNRADAAVLVAAALDHYGFPIAPMPATHRAALQVVDWPELLPTASESQQRGAS